MIDVSKIFESNILASKGSPRGYDYNANYYGPKLFGPHRPDDLNSWWQSDCEKCTPEIVMYGNSHCSQYGPIMERLANEYGKQAALLCVDGVDAGPFHKPLSSWDHQKLNHLSNWKPKLVIWADYWSALAEQGRGSEVKTGIFDERGVQKDYFGYTWNFMYSFEHVMKYADRLLVLGDIPSLPNTPFNAGDTIFTNKVYQQGKDAGNFEFLLNWKEEQHMREARQRTELQIQQTGGLPQYGGKIRFVEVASYFETSAPDFFLQIVDPVIGTLLYKDGNHLNEDGANRLEQLFRKEIFDQRTC